MHSTQGRARFGSGRARACAAALLLGGVAVVAGAAAEASGWRFLRPLFEHLASAQARVPVRIDPPFRLRLLSRAPQLSAQQVTVGVAPALPAPHLLQARELRLSWRWRDLWSAASQRSTVLRLRELELGALDLQLVRDAQGRASWQIGPPGDAAWLPPLIERVSVHGGTISVDDRPQALRIHEPIAPLVLPDDAGWRSPRLSLIGAFGATGPAQRQP